MRRLIFMMSVSLDGFFEGPDHDLSWHLITDELHQHFNDELRGMSTFIEGRVNYELMEGFWPTADADPEAPAPVREFAAIWRETPKIAVSRTLERVGPRAYAAGECSLEGEVLGRTFAHPAVHGLT